MASGPDLPVELVPNGLCDPLPAVAVQAGLDDGFPCFFGKRQSFLLPVKALLDGHGIILFREKNGEMVPRFARVEA